MGLYDEMKRRKTFDEGGNITASFTKGKSGNGVSVNCSVNATGAEIRALIASLAMQVCKREDTSATEFFAEMVVMTMMQQTEDGGNKDDE